MLKPAALFIPAIILATVLSYANSIHNQFIWDDEDFILKNSTIKDWHNWPRVFAEDMIHSARKASNFYRPTQSLTHGVDYLLWKDRQEGHHATNIAFHCLTAIAIYLMLKGIFSKELSFFAALFFAVHPVQTEAVTYISGRSDPMAALFVVLAIILFEKKLFMSCAFFILGILSKESALIAPFLLALYLLFRKGSIKPYLKRILPFIFIMIFYSLLRVTILDFSRTVPENLPKPFFYVPIYLRFSTFMKTLPVYFKILLWPFGLHMERDMDLAVSIFEPQALLGFTMLIFAFFIAYSLRKANRPLLFSAAWFFIAIFPNSNIIPINALIYEHWLYMPSLGFFITIGLGLEALLKKGRVFKYISILLALAISLFYMWRTIERNKEWHDPISFYESTIKYMPNSVRLHNNLAMAYTESGRREDAIREYKRAIELGDYYPQTHYNLSNIYINKGDYVSAVEELKKSIEIDNNFLYSHESLAVIYLNQKRFDEAKKEAEFILQREPYNKVGQEVLRRLSE